MNIREIADTLIRSVSAALNTSDNKFEPRYVEAIIPRLREKAIKIDYFGDRTHAASRRLDYSLSQTTQLTKDTGQNTTLDYVTFSCPSPIEISRGINGLVYVGQKNSSVSFAQYFNREDVANFKERGMFNGATIGYIYQGSTLEFYGNNMLDEVEVRGIFRDPSQVSGFNLETSTYPVSESILEIMTELFRIEQTQNAVRASDTALDNVDTTQRGAISQNIR